MSFANRIRLSWWIYLLAVGARLLPGPRTIDDAYITYRYARNIVSGVGPVYNPGEAVLGTSTPLYTILMSGLATLAGGSEAAFPQISWLLNAGLSIVTCWFLIRLGAQLGHPNAGLGTALIWAIAPMSVTFDIGGMETGLTIALMTGTFYFALRERTVMAGLLAALSLLTRPDTLGFVALIALERIRRGIAPARFNPRPLRLQTAELVAFGLPVLLWVGFSSIFYGSPLPHSITAKVAAYRLPPEAALVRLMQHFATPFFGHHTFGNLWIGIGLLLFPILFALGATLAVRRTVASWPLFLYPWVYFAAFAIANPLIFRWYLAPPLPMFFLGIFLGGERIGRDFKSRWFPPALIGLAFILTLRAWTLRPDHGPSRPAPEMAFIQLELLYQDVGLSLREELQEGSLLAGGDIGALGYYSEARMLDTVGIISPVSLNYYPLDESAYVINYAIPTKLVLDLEPETLVILEAYGRRTLLQDAAFSETYSRTALIPTDIYGSRGMLIFARIREP